MAKPKTNRRATVGVLKLNRAEHCLLRYLAQRLHQPKTAVVRTCVVEVARCFLQKEQQA